ncbi:lipase/lipooxygenase-like calcium-binding lipoprotein [Pontibacter mucosus]|uniref:Lipase/lipooxygenase-like calcium-binding lipoprotein n=1 Tax=Pontibacter mucosus TaxID=1649266 RepID=A0A2T5Y9U6_9BACT|nr:beta-barrel fold lipoprotein [Pontibacter mucosus]PTX13174.1 lipase/lipooxygenase-like calcium-binding lipoprotein [Pontibacter mucosus]
MKKLSFFSLLLCTVLFFAGCDDEGKDPVLPDTATYRVDYSQSGDYEKFIKIITIGGGDFKVRGTTEAMPPVLFDGNLSETSYSFEADNVRELTIHAANEFSAVEDGPASMQMHFVIYKNGKQIDEKTFSYSEVTGEKNEYLNYKANE